MLFFRWSWEEYSLNVLNAMGQTLTPINCIRRIWEWERTKTVFSQKLQILPLDKKISYSRIGLKINISNDFLTESVHLLCAFYLIANFTVHVRTTIIIFTINYQTNSSQILLYNNLIAIAVSPFLMQSQNKQYLWGIRLHYDDPLAHIKLSGARWFGKTWNSFTMHFKWSK